jgi:hypothetical protein
MAGRSIWGWGIRIQVSQPRQILQPFHQGFQNDTNRESRELLNLCIRLYFSQNNSPFNRFDCIRTDSGFITFCLKNYLLILSILSKMSQGLQDKYKIYISSVAQDAAL